MDNHYQNIEAYLDGSLSSEARAAFEQAMEADSDLAQSVAEHRLLLTRLEGLRIRQKVTVALHPPPKTSSKYLWFIAAFLCMLGAAFWLFNTPEPIPEKKILPTAPELPPQTDTKSDFPNPSTPTEIVVPTTPSTPPIALLRQQLISPAFSHLRDGVIRDSVLQTAAAAYAQKNYPEVLPLLANASAEEGIFLHACAAFQQQQYVLAQREFLRLKGGYQYRYEAQWNHMLCLFARGELAAARATLQKMRQDPDFPFREKALGLNL